MYLRVAGRQAIQIILVGGIQDVSNTSTYNSNWINDGFAQQQGNVIAQECIDWNNDITLSCKTWVASNKLATDFPSTTTTASNSSYVQGPISNGTSNTTGPISSAWTNPVVVSGSQECRASGCTRKQIRTKSIETKVDTLQTSFWTYATTTVYGGIAYETHRKKLLREVNALSANLGTPTAFAYAEVAAYLLGQSTLGKSGSGFLNQIKEILGLVALTIIQSK